MPKERRSVTVRVPATTANIGPGFDCIGMAVDLWNELTVERIDGDRDIFEIVGDGAAVLPTDSSNLVVTGLQAAFRAAGKAVPRLHYRCSNNIPFSRGLGSSSAGIVSGLVAGLVLAGHELPVRGQEELLQLAAGIEGHPDNVAPAIYGGFQLGIQAQGRWYTTRIAVPHGLQCVVFIPDKGCETAEARALLSQKVERQDCIHNMGRTALLVHALASNQLHELRYATQDRLHQPQRAKIIPHLYPVMEAALESGAHGAFLSGAGPSVMAFTSGRSGDIYAQSSAERQEQKVVAAMAAAARRCGVPGKIVVTQPTEKGAHVVCADPPLSDHAIVSAL